MAGFELPIGIDIFRGRYRPGSPHPAPLMAGQGRATTGSTCPTSTMCSCPATGSWCRSSPPCSRSTTATHRPSFRTSSTPRRGDYRAAQQRIYYGGSDAERGDASGRPLSRQARVYCSGGVCCWLASFASQLRLVDFLDQAPGVAAGSNRRATHGSGVAGRHQVLRLVSPGLP